MAAGTESDQNTDWDQTDSIPENISIKTQQPPGIKSSCTKFHTLIDSSSLNVYILHPHTKFVRDASSSYCVILLTNIETDQQTNGGGDLLGSGNDDHDF